MMNLIELEHISFKSGETTILDNVSIVVPAGKIVTIIGPNGAGKTTLLKIILGILNPTKGKLNIKQGLKIGYVPQKISLPSTVPITVRRFLNLGQHVNDADLTNALIETGIEKLKERSLHLLSGGEFQRVLFARALLQKPDLLVLDEPAQGLDPAGQEALYGLIVRLNKSLNCGVLLVSHDLYVVLAKTDQVICLNKHICCSGKPHEILDSEPYMSLYRHHHDHIHHLDGSICHD